MVEFRRKRYKDKIKWETRKKQLDYDNEDGFATLYEFSKLTTNSVPEDLKFMTEALRTKLIKVGLTYNRLPIRADIYERAINQLEKVLTHAPLPNYPKDLAYSELKLLSQGLLKLFTDGIKLHITEQVDQLMVFEGYFVTGDDQNHRVSIIQRLREHKSVLSGKMLTPSCQIMLREILGRSTKGKAIAGSDSRIRCGLRYGSLPANYCWCVSIDSGIHDLDTSKNRWRVFGPLTYAYNESRKHPESFYFLQDTTDTPNTFHFNDPTSQLKSHSIHSDYFNQFNLALNRVFRSLCRFS